MQTKTWYWCRRHQRATQRHLRTCVLVGPLRSKAEAEAVGQVLAPLPIRLLPHQRALLKLLIEHDGVLENDDGVVRVIYLALRQNHPAELASVYGWLRRLKELGLIDFSARVPKGTITRVWLAKSTEETQRILGGQ